MSLANVRFRRTASGVYVAPTAVCVGDVSLGADCSLWFGAVVRGDVAPVRIGQRVNIQDNAVVHCDSGIENLIEDDVVIGHGAIVHGQRIGAGTLVGMGATILGRTQIGRGCLVAAGAVVSPGTLVPDGMVAMGVPAKVVRPIKPGEVEYRQWLTTHYVELARRYTDEGFANPLG